MAEDVKGALTTFVSSLPAFPAFLILLGLFVFLLGLSGGITYNNWFPMPQAAARIMAAVAGTIVCAAGIFFWASTRTSGLPQAKDYGITITHPRDNDFVTTVDVHGTIKRALPDGYTLQVFRMYPGDRFVPLRQARVDLASQSWGALSCDIGRGDGRQFAAYLVGPGGAALLDYYAEATRVHNPIREQLTKLTGTEAAWLPVIRPRTPDMVECARVTVRRA